MHEINYGVFSNVLGLKTRISGLLSELKTPIVRFFFSADKSFKISNYPWEYKWDIFPPRDLIILRDVRLALEKVLTKD